MLRRILRHYLGPPVLLLLCLHWRKSGCVEGLAANVIYGESKRIHSLAMHDRIFFPVFLLSLFALR